MLWDHRCWGRRNTCSGTGEEMGWAHETSFARMPSSALGEVCTSCVCAVITSYFLAPPVTWWLLIPRWCGDPALAKMCFSYLVQLPCLHVCVCWGEAFGSICTASPALLWPSIFSSWAVWRSKLFCAVCHQDCSTTECEREATACGLCLVLGSSQGLCLLGWWRSAVLEGRQDVSGTSSTVFGLKDKTFPLSGILSLFFLSSLFFFSFFSRC